MQPSDSPRKRGVRLVRVGDCALGSMVVARSRPSEARERSARGRATRRNFYRSGRPRAEGHRPERRAITPAPRACANLGRIESGSRPTLTAPNG